MACLGFGKQTSPKHICVYCFFLVSASTNAKKTVALLLCWISASEHVKKASDSIAYLGFSNQK